MKKSKKISVVAMMFILLLATGLVSCKKEKPEEVTVESVALLCGDAIEIECGEFFVTDYVVTPAEAASLPSTWTSENDAIVQVSGEMKCIMGMNPGTANIKVEVGGVAAVCAVTVRNIPPSITVQSVVINDGAESVSLREGKTAQLTYTVTPEGAAIFTPAWKSDNEDVAKVSDSGLVTAVAAGTANVSVTLGGVTASIRVIVSINPPDLSSKVFTSGYTMEPSGVSVGAVWNGQDLFTPMGTAKRSCLNKCLFDRSTSKYIFGGYMINEAGVNEACILQTGNFAEWNKFDLGNGKVSAVNDMYVGAGSMISVGGLDGKPVCWKGLVVNFINETASGAYRSMCMNKGSIYSCGYSMDTTPACYADIDGTSSMSGTGSRYTGITMCGTEVVLVSTTINPKTLTNSSAVMIGKNVVQLSANSSTDVIANCVLDLSDFAAGFVAVGGLANVSGKRYPVVWLIGRTSSSTTPSLLSSTILKDGISDCYGAVNALCITNSASSTTPVISAAGYVLSEKGVKTACYWDGNNASSSHKLVRVGNGEKSSEATSIFVLPTAPGKVTE